MKMAPDRFSNTTGPFQQSICHSSAELTVEHGVLELFHFIDYNVACNMFSVIGS